MWSLILSGPVTDCYAELEQKANRAKENKSNAEKENIEAAVHLFKQLVPQDERFGCSFTCVGSNLVTDISFNSTCAVYLK
jgi:hypothetical protein